MISGSGKKEIGELNFRLLANADSPVVNPAFVVKNWGDHQVSLKVNGKEIEVGKAFRVGLLRKVNRYDLVVWLKLESISDVEVSMNTKSQKK